MSTAYLSTAILLWNRHLEKVCASGRSLMSRLIRQSAFRRVILVSYVIYASVFRDSLLSNVSIILMSKNALRRIKFIQAVMVTIGCKGSPGNMLIPKAEERSRPTPANQHAPYHSMMEITHARGSGWIQMALPLKNT